MISFRYHLVTIVAVFLALGLGLLAGTTVINRVLVDRLRKQTDQATNRADTAERARVELRNEVAALVPSIVADKLATDVVLVTYEGSDSTTLNQAQASLKAAGANVLGVLPVTSRVSDPDASKSLAKILGVPALTPAGVLQRELATQLARRLSGAAPHGSGGANDLLNELISNGFIRKGDISPQTLKEIGQDGQVVVAVSGGEPRPSPQPSSLMVPLVKELVGQMPVAAGEPSNSSDGLVTLLRADGDLNQGQLVTVDDLDRQVGGAALVLGLEQLLRSPTDGGGSYGLDGGTLILGDNL
ncbi:MAG: copper transporter, partial [Actinomycetota bacterium]